jgi:hypothetical protein
MPWQFENVSDEVSKSTEELKKKLIELTTETDNLDKAFKKLNETEKETDEINQKFAKNLEEHTKVLKGYGLAGISTARGLKAVGAVADKTATSLSLIGLGAGEAVAGFKSLSSASSTFQSDMSNSERSVIGLVSKLDGMEGKMKGMSASIPVSIKIDGLEKLEDLEKSLDKMSKDVKITLESGGIDSDSFESSVRRSGGSSSRRSTPKPEKLPRPEKERDIWGVQADVKDELDRQSDVLQMQADRLMDEFGLKDQKDRPQYIDFEVRIAGLQEMKRYVYDTMDETQLAFLKAEIGTKSFEDALDSVKNKYPEIAVNIERAHKLAIESARELTSVTSRLHKQVEKEVSSVGDLFGKMQASGSLDAAGMGGGMGGNATGMLAAGAGAAFLATKIADVAQEFTNAVVGLAKYRTEIGATEKQIIGMNKGGLEAMRKDLYLTREQASEFFGVVKKGVNQLGMTKGEIMDVSKALQETFGGDQTERLKEYVNLIESIPTIKTDLSVSASMDDQAATLFGLAQAGKMDVVADFKTAGLLGGDKPEKQEGSDMANSTQKTAAASESIRDFLMTSLYPQQLNAFTEMINWGSKTFGAVASGIGILGAMKMFLGNTMVTGHQKIVDELRAQNVQKGVEQTPELPSAVNGSGSLLKMGAAALKTTKGLSIMTAVTGVASVGFGKLEDNLIKSGDKIGAAGANLGSSLSKIASYAGAGALIASAIPIPALSQGVGAIIGGLYGVYEESDNLKKSFKTLSSKMFSKEFDPIASKEMLDVNEKINSYQTKMIKSGMALQQSLAQNKQAFDSLKYGLFKAEKELANLKIENMQEVGGGPEEFAKAVEFAAEVTKKQYQTQMADAEQRRNKIMKSDDMTSEMRSLALHDLHEKELKAVNSFVAGMNEAIEALFKSPEIIQAGLKEQLTKMTLDFADNGGMSSDRLDSAIKDQMKALEDQLNGVFTATDEASKKTEEKIQGLNERKLQKEEEIGNRIKQIQKDQLNRDKLHSLIKKRMELSNSREDIKPLKSRFEEEADRVSGQYKDKNGPDLSYDEKKVKYERELADIDAKLRELTSQEVTEKKRLLDEKIQLERLSKVMVDDGNGGKKVDVEAAKDMLKDVVKDQKQVDEEMAQARKEMEDNFKLPQITGAQSVAKKLAAAKAEAKRANADYEIALEDKEGTGYGDAEKTKNDKDKVAIDLAAQLSEMTKGIVDEILKMDPGLDRIPTTSLVEEMIGVSTGLGGMEEIIARFPNLSKEMKASLIKSNDALQKMSDLEARKVVLNDTSKELESVLEIDNGITTILKDQVLTVQQITDITSKLIQAQQESWKKFNETIFQQERQAELYKRSAVMAGIVGNGIEAGAKAAQEEMEMNKKKIQSYEKSVAIMKGKLPILEDELKSSQDIVASSKKALDAAKDAAKDKADIALKQKAYDEAVAKSVSIDTRISSTKAEVNNAQEEAQKLRAEYGSVGDMVVNAFKDLNASAAGLRLNNLKELSEIVLDMGEYAGTVESAGNESFAIAKRVAQERLALERETLDKSLELSKTANDALVDEAVRVAKAEADDKKTPLSKEDETAVRNKAQLEVDATMESKKRLENARMERDYKKSIVDSALASKALKEKELGVQQDLIDDAMSFVSDFGGSFSAILELQNMSVGVARQQLDAATEARDRIIELKDGGLKLFEAEADVAKKTMELRKQEMGIQKSMMDRLLGAVFGDIRKDVGARKGRGTDQALMGVEATRMKLASGLYTSAEGGTPGTIEQRGFKRQLAGAGGAFNMSGNASSMDILGKVQAAIKSAPKKNPLEEAMAEATGLTAENTKPLLRGDKPGSFYTHDVTAEGQASRSENLLSGILAVLTDIKTEAGIIGDSGSDENKTSGQAFKLEKKGYQKALENYKVTKKGMKDESKGLDSVQDQLEQANRDKAIRISENNNPYAENAAGIADFDRIMAGKSVQATGGVSGTNSESKSNKKAGAPVVSDKTIFTLRKLQERQELARAEEDVQAAKDGLERAQVASKAVMSLEDQSEEEWSLQQKVDRKKALYDVLKNPEDKEEAKKQYELAQDKLEMVQERNAKAIFGLPKGEDEAKNAVVKAEAKRDEKAFDYNNGVKDSSFSFQNQQKQSRDFANSKVRDLSGDSIKLGGDDRARSLNRFKSQSKLGGGGFTGGATLGGGDETGGARLGGKSTTGKGVGGSLGGGAQLSGKSTIGMGLGGGATPLVRPMSGGASAMTAMPVPMSSGKKGSAEPINSRAAGMSEASQNTGMKAEKAPGGSETAEGSTQLTVSGEISVRFDSKMFRAEVAKIMATEIKSADNVKSIKAIVAGAV